jgi:hypothetical protein
MTWSLVWGLVVCDFTMILVRGVLDRWGLAGLTYRSPDHIMVPAPRSPIVASRYRPVDSGLRALRDCLALQRLTHKPHGLRWLVNWIAHIVNRLWT